MGLFARKPKQGFTMQHLSYLNAKGEIAGVDLIVPQGLIETEICAQFIWHKLRLFFSNFCAKQSSKSLGIFQDDRWAAGVDIEYFMSPSYYGCGLFGLEIVFRSIAADDEDDIGFEDDEDGDSDATLGGVSLAVGLTRVYDFEADSIASILSMHNIKPDRPAVSWDIHWVADPMSFLKVDDVRARPLPKNHSTSLSRVGGKFSYRDIDDDAQKLLDFISFPHRIIVDPPPVR